MGETHAGWGEIHRMQVWPKMEPRLPHEGVLEEAGGFPLCLTSRMRKVDMEMGGVRFSQTVCCIPGSVPSGFIHHWIFIEHLLHARQCSGCQKLRSKQKQYPCSSGAYFLLEWNQMTDTHILFNHYSLHGV